ncbi:MAG: flavodoxin family protein [Omnitrophica WOR_2 bacterium]|jgi:flavodoxin
MVVLIYDSLYGNTAQIAHKIAETVRIMGNELMEMRLNETNNRSVKDASIIIIGSPTQAFNASKAMIEFLDNLDADSVKDKKTVVFDTRLMLESINSKFLRWLVNRGGYATSPMTKKLKKKGAVILGAEGFLVTDREGPLVEGEIERAGKWIKSLLQ